MMSSEENGSNRTEASDSEYSDLVDENIIKILFATDINLGYEQTVDRGNYININLFPLFLIVVISCSLFYNLYNFITIS